MFNRFFTQAPAGLRAGFFESMLPFNLTTVKMIAAALSIMELGILTANILAGVKLTAPYHVIQFSIIPIMAGLFTAAHLHSKARLNPEFALRLSYIYPGIMLVWAACLGAAGLSYYGQYTAYVIGICSIAFLFYQEVFFTVGLYAACGALFLSLCLYWGLGSRQAKELIGIFGNTVVVNVVAILASRLNFGIRLKLYLNEREANERNLELKQLNARLEDIASTDRLTGIANRHQMESYLDAAQAKVKLSGGKLSCALFDIDHFKQVNDTFGHETGDRVLRGLAELVKRSIRAGDFFGRWGGEEFLLLYFDAGLEQAFASAENIRRLIENHQVTEETRVTCSFGVAEFFPDDTIKSFVSRADKAMYRAKGAGRNCVSR